ncbi:hypothetical protein PoB_003961000 [Plakobranchus ocellatus]|uniref:Uncharacterized protein n=1 Tax=Plakobranchus ocellatus TaxID=259542 RepID=A0AAV4AXL3_9GAST|nr:hypothetical protein PoB_003961000 [Plakobranchus ocellatus]
MISTPLSPAYEISLFSLTGQPLTSSRSLMLDYGSWGEEIAWDVKESLLNPENSQLSMAVSALQMSLPLLARTFRCDEISINYKPIPGAMDYLFSKIDRPGVADRFVRLWESPQGLITGRFRDFSGEKTFDSRADPH